jgi:hypothetical protein
MGGLKPADSIGLHRFGGFITPAYFVGGRLHLRRAVQRCAPASDGQPRGRADHPHGCVGFCGAVRPRIAGRGPGVAGHRNRAECAGTRLGLRAHHLSRAGVLSAHLAGWAAFIGLTGLGLLFWPFAHATAHLLVPGDEQVIELTAGFLQVLAPMFGIIGAQFALVGAFRGSGQTLTAMVLSLTMQWLVQLPASWWLATQTPLGFKGIWWGFPIANVLALIVTLQCTRRSRHTRRLTEDIVTA